MTGRLRTGDTVEDILNSIERKGAPARADGSTATPVVRARPAPTVGAPDAIIATPLRAPARSTSGGDTPADVLASIERKGAPMRESGPSRRRRALAEDIDELIGGTTLPDRAREVPIIGDTLGDWLGSGTSGASGAVHGATLGFEDELAGRAAQLGGGDYEATRDRVRAVHDADRESSPNAYLGGEVAGAVGSALATPSLAAGRATVLGRLGVGALENAGLGALAAAGESDAEGEELADDMLTGAGAGAAFGAIGGVGGEALGFGANRLRSFGDRAGRLTLGSVTGGNGNALSTALEREMASFPGGIDGVADLLEREGIVSAGATVEDISEALAGFLRRNGEAIGDIERAGDDLLPEGYDVEPFVERLSGVADDIRADPYRAGEISSLGRDVDGWLAASNSQGALSPGMDARVAARRAAGVADAGHVRPATEGGGRLSGDRVRRAVGDARSRVRYHDAAANDPASAVARRAYEAVQDAYTNQIDEVLPGAAERLRPLRLNYAVGAELNPRVEDAVSRAARRSGPGLRSSAFSGGLLAAGNPATAAATAIAGDSALSRLPSMRAAAARATRRGLATPGAEAIGRYAPALLDAVRRGGSTAAGVLSAIRHADPEFAAATESMTTEEILDSVMGSSPSMVDEELDGWDDAALGFEPEEPGEWNDDDFGFVEEN